MFCNYDSAVEDLINCTSSVPRSSTIELIVFSLFLPPHYLSVQRGCHPFHATCLFSLLLLLPLPYLWIAHTFSWFAVMSRQCEVSPHVYMSPQYPAHLLSTPSLSVISLLHTCQPDRGQITEFFQPTTHVRADWDWVSYVHRMCRTQSIHRRIF